MYLIDLDGTLYSGNERIDGAIEFVAYLIEKEIPFLFLTNNASRTPKENVVHVEKLGFQGIQEHHFYSSAMAAAKYVAINFEARKAFMIGMEGLRQSLLQEGFELVDHDADFVFVGLNKAGDYDLYSQALTNLLQGAKLVGTNNDRVLPHDGHFMIGNGSVVAMLEYASNQTSMKIGKPYATIVEMASQHVGVPIEKMIMIGDNLETDILLGEHANIETIFVTTGVHTVADIEALHIHPTHVIHNLKELIT